MQHETKVRLKKEKNIERSHLVQLTIAFLVGAGVAGAIACIESWNPGNAWIFALVMSIGGFAGVIFIPIF